MTALLKNLDQYQKGVDTFGFFDDFLQPPVTGDLWTPLTADSSSASTLVLTLASTGSQKGILSITQDATDNDEIYFANTNNLFLIANGKPIIYECRFQYAELNTNTDNLMFGLFSPGATPNALIDNGGGPAASGTMAVIYKIDGGTVWRTRSQIGAAVGQTDTISNLTAGSSSYVTARIEINPVSSTNADVIYSIDGKQLTDVNNHPIKDNLVYTNAVTFPAFFGCKTGSATAEVLLVDYCCAYQKR